MLTKRLIACFDVVNGRVTKAQQFRDNIDVAPAEGLAQHLYDDQIDEIVFYDITASAEKRKIDLETVRRVARHVFVPFTVGGGIRSVDDMFEVLKAGAEKISVDSMAVRHPEIIRDGAEAFGRQCIVLSTQVKRVGARSGIPSGYEVFIDGAREATGIDALEWVRRGEELGFAQGVERRSRRADTGQDEPFGLGDLFRLRDQPAVEAEAFQRVDDAGGVARSVVDDVDHAGSVYGRASRRLAGMRITLSS